MTDLRTLQLLQLTDSAFPTGAFSHSFGLETAIAEGRVGDEVSFAGWLRAYLEHALGPSDAAAMALAMGGIAGFVELDGVLFALTTASETRQALRHIGSALAYAYRSIGMEPDRTLGHPALQTAAAMRTLGIEAPTAIGAYLSSVLAALGSVAARAVPLGQRSISRVLWELRPRIAEVVTTAMDVKSVEEIGSWAIEQEIDALRHRLLDARMFSS